MRYVLAVLLLLSLSWQSHAETVPVYVLSIGSGDYAQSDDNDYFSFGSNEAAYLGARRVARTFSQNGARHVIQVLGRDGERVSRSDIFGSIDDIVDRARRDPSGNPLLVVYLSAHGLSDDFGYNLFVMPGDVVIDKTRLDMTDPNLMRIADIDGVETAAPSAREIFDALEQTGLEFLLLVDTCYETTTGLDLTALRRVSRQMADLAGNVSDIIRFMSLPRDPHPMVFSAPPGSLAHPALDPLSARGDFIAPLARRIVLASQSLGSGGSLGLSQLVEHLVYESADPEADPGGITWYSGALSDRAILRAGVGSGTIDKRRGTSYSVTPCCSYGSSSSSDEGTSVSPVVTGTVAFSGRGGDFVSDDRSVRGKIDPSEQTVWSVGPREFDLDLVLSNGQELSIMLSGPGSAFKEGVYENVGRAGFEEAGQAGLSVTMDGNGCNEISGRVRVTDTVYGASGALERLAFEFEQVCDGGPGSLTGIADLTFTRSVAQN